ncbi:MAG: glycosyltransferase family 4 protein [Thermoleophilia bacterium]
MRVGFDARAMRYRGIDTYSRNLLIFFAATNIEFVVFCRDGERGAIPSADSFTLVSANIDPLSSRGRTAFRDIVRESGVDLLHVPSTWAPTPAPVPLVATVHDVTPLLYPRTFGPLLHMRYRSQLARTVQEADRIITVSYISRSALSASTGVNVAKVRVIHNGVSKEFQPQSDPEMLRAVRSRYALPERFAFWVGDFRPEKNLHRLLQAWPRVQKRLPEPLPLVLAGFQAGLFKTIAKEVERTGMSGNVFFPGFIRADDLPAVYSAAMLFIFPSLYEGFGLPPLEAMACGTPCVVSNSSSLPEVTGSAALLFNPTSLESIEDAVVRLATDPDLYEHLRREGRRQSALFSWDHAAEETLAVYRSVLEKDTRWEAL